MLEKPFVVECNVCKKQYDNWVGSTPCCGSIAYIIEDGIVTGKASMWGFVDEKPVQPLIVDVTVPQYNGDAEYQKYALILELDIRKSPKQRITIGETEYTVEMLVQELRTGSEMGKNIVSNYVGALERLKEIKKQKENS